jgi:hypothetical protein
MRGGARQGPALVAASLAALALAACGGSGHGDSSSAGSPPPPPPGSKTAATGSNATPTPSGSGSGSTSPAGSAGSGSPVAANPGKGSSSAGAPPPSITARKARRKARAVRHRLEAKAGAAAPFLVGQGDNSIPTYGSEASGSESAAAEASLSGYLAARAAGDWASACTLMLASVAKQLALLAGEAGGSKPSCVDAYAKLSEHVPASERADPLTHGLTALRVESPHAFALFYGPHHQQYMMPMTSEGGAWKVTQIAPLPYPIGAQPQTSP